MCSASTVTDYGAFNARSIMMYGSIDSGDGDRFQWHRDDGTDINLATTPHVLDGSNIVEMYAEQFWGWGRFRSLGVHTSDTAKLNNHLAPGVTVVAGTSPAVSSQIDGALDVFVRGSNGTIYHRYCTGNCGATATDKNRLVNWQPASGWFQLPTDGITDHRGSPASVSWANGRVDVVTRRADNTIWHKWYEGAWAGWESLGSPPGGAASSPAIASRGANRLDIFARSTNGSLYWRRWSPGWSGWEFVASPPAGVTSFGDPAAISPSSLVTEVYVIGANDGRPYYKRWANSAWSPWFFAGNENTNTGDRPAVASQTAGAVDLFVRGNNGRLWHRFRTTQNGAWSGSFQLGGEIGGAPAAEAHSGHVDVFAIEAATYPHAETARGVRYRHYPK
jgi:hypothetical protein